MIKKVKTMYLIEDEEESEYIKSQLKANNCSIQDIANEFDVSKQFVSLIFKGRNYMNEEMKEFIESKGVKIEKVKTI